jgi:ribosomal protein S18 acetylase RimI-like enzyme
MTTPTNALLYDAIDATWPAAERREVAGWTIRRGDGGGSRVSAATGQGDIAVAEAAMDALGQPRLFMIHDGDEALDSTLAAAGYVVKDPVNLYAAEVTEIAANRPPPVTSFQVWPPLQAQREVWAAGGVDDARIAIMERATCPKSAFLGRANDRPSGAVYAGVHQGIVMLHALEVAGIDRRQSLGKHLTQAVAIWGQSQGATHLALLATKANIAANALYTSLGMQVVGQYHYRIQPD